jgi:hypothetical protein
VQYFENIDRRIKLQNILVIWSTEHEQIAYRQGMHEIAATILYVVEAEVAAWEAYKSRAGVVGEMTSAPHPLADCFRAQSVEAYTFWLFDRLMQDVSELYDPMPTEDGNPPVVAYCIGIQGTVYSL